MVAWYHRLALIGVMVCLFIFPKVVKHDKRDRTRNYLLELSGVTLVGGICIVVLATLYYE